MNKIIHVKNVFFLLSCILYVLFFFSGCAKPRLSEQNKTIDKTSWSRQQVPAFKIQVHDNKKHYDFFLNVRHTYNYPYSNLSLLIEEVSPQRAKKVYRVNLKLSSPDGRWKGIGTGNLFNHRSRFLKNHHFADTGLYIYRIKQNMAYDPLPGISDIGIEMASGKVIALK